MTSQPTRSIAVPSFVFVSATAVWIGAFSRHGSREMMGAYTPASLVSLAGGESAFFVASTCAAAVVVSALATIFARRWGDKADRTVRNLLAEPRTALTAISLLAFAASLFITVAIAQMRTLSEDEKTHLFQAKLLLMGRLSVDLPPEAVAFRQPFVVGTATHWSGQYFWAQPALLALGLLVKAPWILSPIELALTTFMTGLLVEEVTSDRRASLLAALLCASSPFLVLNAATMLSVSLSALCGVSSLWALARLSKRADTRASLVLGLSTACALHNRPLDHVALLLGAGVVIASADRSIGALGTVARRAWIGIAIAIAFALLHLPLNRAVTGDFLRNGYFLFNQEQGWKTFGFGQGPLGHPHTLPIAAAKTVSVAAREAIFLGGSPLLLLPIGLWALGPAAPRRVWAAVPLVLFYHVAYFFYASTPISTAGPVYYVPLAPVVLAWIAVAAVALHDRLGASAETSRIVPAAMLAHACGALLVFWPSAAMELGRAVDEAHRCEDMAGQLDPSKRYLVFTALGQTGSRSWTHYGPLPSPKLDDRVLYPRSEGPPIDAQIASRFAEGREVYIARCLFELRNSLEHYDPSTGRRWPVE